MEIEFQKTTYPYMKTVLYQIQNTEQTQDVRLPDGMPDIGRVIAAWGLPLIRSKEWRSGGIGASGGVMAWVLYEPEDGSGVKSMEAWIPFQWKWDLPDGVHDGQILLSPHLKSLDARSTSAGKMLLRATLSVLAEALEPAKLEVYHGEDLPDDVQLLQKTYPVELQTESGEKTFVTEEELQLPQDMDESIKPIRYGWNSEITEQKIMADKLVFHGFGNFHMLYLSQDGKVKSYDARIPYSQYAQLDKDYGPDATARIRLILTGLEPEISEGKLILRASMAAQYVICDREMLCVLEDAYSTKRQLQTQMQQIQIPALLEQRSDPIRHSAQFGLDIAEIVDSAWLPEHPTCRVSGGAATTDHAGVLQMLYYDGEGKLQFATELSEDTIQIPTFEDNLFRCDYASSGNVNTVRQSDGAELSVAGFISSGIYSGRSMQMITGISLGDAKQADSGRPSLILKRAGDDSLWEIAKSCSTTVAAIMTANQLQQEPEDNRLLLIPVP